MADLRAAAKKRAQRRAGAPAREPGDMGEKPEHDLVMQADPNVYMGEHPETIRRQGSRVTIHVASDDQPDPSMHAEPDKDESPDGTDDPTDEMGTAAGVAALHAKLQAAAKKRATRRTAR